MRLGIIKILLTIFAVFLSPLCLNAAVAQEISQQAGKKEAGLEVQAEQKEEQKFVGEFFETKVTTQNYYFIKSLLAVFGSGGSPQPKTPEEEEKYVWEQLLLSYESFRRGIMVEQKEVDEEVGKTLEAEKVTFDWKQDKEAYEKWVKEKANEPAALFENQIRHLLQIEKLRRAIMESIKPQVLEKEAYQEFLNENNTLGVELVEFNAENEARKFYLQVKKNPKKWDEEKAGRPNDFKRPGPVSLEFLVDIWRFPQYAAYTMMRMAPDSIHPPAPIYKGYAVFKVLDKSPADKKQYKTLKDSYYEQIRRRKRYEWLGKWFEDFKRQANIKIYALSKKEEGKNE